MDIVMQLCQKQSTPWKRIVEIRIEKVMDTVKAFVDEAFEEISALRTFTDNVINLAIESCLIQDLPSVFTARLTNDLTDDEVSHIAIESDDIRSYRSEIEEDIKQLKRGLEECRRFRPRSTVAKLRSTKKRIYETRTTTTPTSALDDFGAAAPFTQPQTVQLPLRRIPEMPKPKADVSEVSSGTGLFGTSTDVPGLSTSATAPLPLQLHKRGTRSLCETR
ncbi:dynamin family protein [Colletotrichum asianum]|uniref:Dynamin family protein n=1 Tax=Colletotrichum asianum TaxID=702518 RepID=A0A8H3VWD7_9PEZI|nr:dynamin family protein [Colletotrichum asianum]